MKYFIVLIILYGLWKGFKGFLAAKKAFSKTWLSHINSSLMLLVGIQFSYLILQSYQGRIYENDAITLAFPLREGKYYIASGGSNGVLNNHYGRGSRTQLYALDINKLGKYSKVSHGLGSTRNEYHHIFGEPVYAPCNGKVIEIKDGVADNLGSSMKVTPADGQGNFIVLDCQGTVVSLVHLKQNSLKVKLGDNIVTGTLLASVGNSGFSQEPHLHLQAARIKGDSVLEGVPMEFDQIKPYRNMVIQY
ncbi:MAG: M23 family metallopeptidase [Flavobacteriaceae bacterium]